MKTSIFSPPAVFLILLAALVILARVLSMLAFKKKDQNHNTLESYSCGEEVPTHLIQPDYGQFFPFAFFFTILHVVALMIATVPVETIESFAIAAIYIAGGLVGLAILYRR